MVHHRKAGHTCKDTPVCSEGPRITFGVSYPWQRHLKAQWLNTRINMYYLTVFVGKEFGGQLGDNSGSGSLWGCSGEVSQSCSRVKEGLPGPGGSLPACWLTHRTHWCWLLAGGLSSRQVESSMRLASPGAKEIKRDSERCCSDFHDLISEVTRCIISTVSYWLHRLALFGVGGATTPGGGDRWLPLWRLAATLCGARSCM